MKQIAASVADYFLHIDRIYLTAISLALTILIWYNYHFNLNDVLLLHHSFAGKLWRSYLLFSATFITTWVAAFAVAKQKVPASAYFWTLLILSPAVFAVKVSLSINDLVYFNDPYLRIVVQWPLKAAATIILSFALWKATGRRRPFAGLKGSGFDVRPYFLVLFILLPLLMWAGRAEDFQHVYPKLQMIGVPVSPLQKLLFELSYGLDFFTIELFFRGFLILAFIRYGGQRAILPMAAFYCTIHFGKPLFECVSSYFGGILLGAVVYKTRSIWDGLVIHLGIAWMMECIGMIY